MVKDPDEVVKDIGVKIKAMVLTWERTKLPTKPVLLTRRDD